MGGARRLVRWLPCVITACFVKRVVLLSEVAWLPTVEMRFFQKNRARSFFFVCAIFFVPFSCIHIASARCATRCVCAGSWSKELYAVLYTDYLPCPVGLHTLSERVSFFAGLWKRERFPSLAAVDKRLLKISSSRIHPRKKAKQRRPPFVMRASQGTRRDNATAGIRCWWVVWIEGVNCLACLLGFPLVRDECANSRPFFFVSMSGRHAQPPRKIMYSASLYCCIQVLILLHYYIQIMEQRELLTGHDTYCNWYGNQRWFISSV